MKQNLEPSPESLRSSLKGAVTRLDEIKAKICTNESRLIALEVGPKGGRVLWDDACKSADNTIASIAAIEIGVRAFGTDGIATNFAEQPLLAMPGFTNSDLQDIAARGETAKFGAISMMQGYLGE